MKVLEAAFSSLPLTNMGFESEERVVVFSDTIRADEKPSAADRSRRFHENYVLYSQTLTGTTRSGSTFLIIDNGKLQV